LREEHRQNETQKIAQPPDEAAEVVTCRGENGVVGVAVASGEIVAAHSVLVLEMADDGLDGGAAFHLSFDGRRHAPLLPGRVDFELVLEKVRAEWAMICTTHNLLKLFTLANAASASAG
jgi:hypothetical protein